MLKKNQEGEENLIFLFRIKKKELSDKLKCHPKNYQTNFLILEKLVTATVSPRKIIVKLTVWVFFQDKKEIVYMVVRTSSSNWNQYLSKLEKYQNSQTTKKTYDSTVDQQLLYVYCRRHCGRDCLICCFHWIFHSISLHQKEFSAQRRST